jgi:hypothetical protein
MHNHVGMMNTALPFAGRPSLAIMPWSLRAWPPLLWQVGDVAPSEFHHLSTHVMSPAGAHCRLAGQTIWAGTIAGNEAGMAWDWVEIGSGIVAMADPMSVVTNLRIVGDEGEVLTSQAAARVLNDIVHALPWQDEVGRALATTSH